MIALSFKCLELLSFIPLLITEITNVPYDVWCTKVAARGATSMVLSLLISLILVSCRVDHSWFFLLLLLRLLLELFKGAQETDFSSLPLLRHFL